MKLVANYNDNELAETAAKGLNEIGIACEIAYRPGEYVEGNIPIGGYCILVDENDFAKADDFLCARWRQPVEGYKSDFICPSCGSTIVTFDCFSYRKILIQLFLLAMPWLWFSEKKFYCKMCRHTWNLREETQPGAAANSHP